MNILTTTERLEAPAISKGGQSAQGQASFAAALRDLEQAAAAMLAMPYVEAPPPTSAATQREAITPRSAPTEGDSTSRPMASNLDAKASGSRTVLTDRTQAAPEPDCDAALTAAANDRRDAGRAVAVASLGVSNEDPAAVATSDVQYGMLSEALAPTVHDATLMAAATRATLPSEGVQTPLLVARDAQPASVAQVAPAIRSGLSHTIVGTRPEGTRTAAPPDMRIGAPAPAQTQLIAHLADNHVAVAVRAALLDVDAERELLARMGAELGAHGIHRYSIQLNGLSVAGPTESGGQ